MATRYRNARPRARTNGGKFALLAIVLAIVGVLAAGGVGIANLMNSWLSDLPDATDEDAFALAAPSKVYSADGVLLAEFATENRIATTIDRVSPYVLKATVDTEDVRFYEHGAIDIQGIGRAILSQLSGQSEGGSTITQQLVKNTLLIDEMSDYTIKRKVREAYLAYQVEELYTKDEILIMYLNTINYGDGAYGIEAASEHYFSKSASELTLDEAALLVGIPQSPTNLNPVNYPDAAKERRNVVLERMLTAGDITQEEYDEACAKDINLNLSETPTNGIYQYPYFVSYVQSELSEIFTDDEIYRGGLTIYTTLDTRLQEAAEDACADALSGQSDSLEYSLTCVDPDNGHVLAMVGGRDYYTDQFNLATQARRQAGSSFKTFTLVTAIDEGISPEMTLNASSPATIVLDDTSTEESGTWTVSNSEGTGYGSMTLERATWLSVNTVYARLAHILGATPIVQTCKDMGITSTLQEVESISLGTQGVCTLEMANAYATLAAGGVHHDASCVTKVVSYHGKTVYEEPSEGTQAIREEVAYATTEVLEGVVSSGTGYRAKLDNGQTAAGKTGTSENNRDNWFCGYTPQLSCAIWLGSREEQAIRYNGSSGYGGTTCAPVWKDFIDEAYEILELEVEDFAEPETKIEYDYDRWSSELGTSGGSSSSGSDSSGQTRSGYSDDDDDDDTSGSSRTSRTGTTSSSGTSSATSTSGGEGTTSTEGGGGTTGGGTTDDTGGTTGGGTTGGDTGDTGGGGTGGTTDDSGGTTGGGTTGGDTGDTGGGGTTEGAAADAMSSGGGYYSDV